MAKLIVMLVSIVVVSIATCYVVNRICNTTMCKSSDEIDVLHFEHEAMMRVNADIWNEVRSNGHKLDALLNMTTNQFKDFRHD